MNAFLIPRPSLRGAILWQRRKSAIAVTFSPRVLTWTVFVPIVVLCAGGVLPWPVLKLIAPYWWQILTCILIANLAAATWVSISREGVRARHLFDPFGRLGHAPLGGEFKSEMSDPEDSTWNIVDHWNSYDVQDVEARVVFPALRPVATERWLTAQLHRVQALQLPAARVLDSHAAKSDTIATADSSTGSQADRT